MVYSLAFGLLALVAGAASSGALAQSSSVYIGQVDPSASSTSAPRRGASPGFDQILSNLSAGSLDPFGDDSGGGTSSSRLTAGQTFGATSGALTASQTNNLAILNQVGTNNTGIIAQTGQSNSASATIVGSSNQTNQAQSGNNSRSALSVEGDANTLVTRQNGNNNTSTLSVVGSQNALSNTQNGDGLSFGLSVIGRGANIAITQNGGGTTTVGGARSSAVASPLPLRR